MTITWNPIHCGILSRYSWSKLAGTILFSIGLQLWSQALYSGEIETAVGKEMLTEYTKEQLKFRLAEHINKNPHLVFSTNPKIGTESLRFVGQSLALYGLLTAKTDRDRMWSATHLILSPEPTTALVLLAVQLADTLISLKSQATLTKIYAEISAIQANTVATIRSITEIEAQRQTAMLQGFIKTTEEIRNIQQKLLDSPVSLYLTDQSHQTPNAQELSTALELFRDLDNKLSLLNGQVMLTAAVFKTSYLSAGEVTSVITQINNINKDYDPLRENTQRTLRIIQYFFATTNASELQRLVLEERQSHNLELRIYQQCVKTLNQSMTSSFWKQWGVFPNNDLIINETELALAIEDCTKRFNLMRNFL